MRVLIAGYGYIGEPLGALLADRGDEVFGLRRNPTSVQAPAKPIAADLTDPSTLTDLPQFDAIVYAVSAGRGGEEAYRTAYIDGLRNLMERIALSTLKRFIFVSSTAVYAQDDGSWVDEESATTPDHYSGQIMLEAERIAHDSVPEAIAVRFGGIYGPGRTRTIDAVRGGTAVCADEQKYLNHIHRDDCAGVLAHLLHHRDPAPLYIGVDDEPEDRAVMMDWIAAQLGVDPPARVPAEEAPSRGGNKRCSNRRLRKSGYAFNYPTYREGYGMILENYPA